MYTKHGNSYVRNGKTQYRVLMKVEFGYANAVIIQSVKTGWTQLVFDIQYNNNDLNDVTWSCPSMGYFEKTDLYSIREGHKY